MAGLVVLGPSDHLAGVAAQHGVRDPQRIWDDPANADLRALRGNPLVLAEGDELWVPDRDPPEFEVPAGRRHGFRVPTSALALRLRLLDTFGEPRSDARVKAIVEGRSDELVTDGDGIVSVPIRTSSTLAQLELDDVVIELEIGRLDPLDTPGGLRARMVGLGYLSGTLDGDDPDDLRFAIELFQHDHGLAVDGIASDELRAAIEDAFGT